LISSITKADKSLEMNMVGAEVFMVEQKILSELIRLGALPFGVLIQDLEHLPCTTPSPSGIIQVLQQCHMMRKAILELVDTTIRFMATEMIARQDWFMTQQICLSPLLL
jgi:hypothetical protein